MTADVEGMKMCMAHGHVYTSRDLHALAIPKEGGSSSGGVPVLLGREIDALCTLVERGVGVDPDTVEDIIRAGQDEALKVVMGCPSFPRVPSGIIRWAGGGTVTTMAAEYGRGSTLRMLHERGFDVPSSCVYLAVRNGHADVVRQLLEWGVTPRLDAIVEAMFRGFAVASRGRSRPAADESTPGRSILEMLDAGGYIEPYTRPPEGPKFALRLVDAKWDMPSDSIIAGLKWLRARGIMPTAMSANSAAQSSDTAILEYLYSIGVDCTQISPDRASEAALRFIGR